MDEISTTLKSKDIGIFVASETWFRDIHTESVSEINGYSCFRDDRLHRVGGGVAIWAKHELRPRRILIGRPSFIECVAVAMQNHILVIGCYFPPQVAVAKKEEITTFLIELIDEFLTCNTNFNVILCGDLNRYEISDICNHCNLSSVYTGSTYGQTQLDYILMSENIASYYSASVNAPFDNSTLPHLPIFACQDENASEKRPTLKKNVYDLRESFVNDFLDVLSLIDWSFLYHEGDSLNLKCELFNYCIFNAFTDTIPCKVVEVVDNNKPWITPFVKSLINDRWFAYRVGNMPLYRHLKQKVKDAIARSKLKWANKLSARSI